MIGKYTISYYTYTEDFILISKDDGESMEVRKDRLKPLEDCLDYFWWKEF